MAQRPQQTWHKWPGWSMISASDSLGFTLWFTGLHGTGKSTLAALIKDALAFQGYKVEIIDSNTLSYWLQRELHIDETIKGDRSHIPGYDAFVTYLCAILARNGVITITTSVSPYLIARSHAREHIPHFVEVHLHCSLPQRRRRLHQSESEIFVKDSLYQEPENVELSINTEKELAEQSALHILLYLEKQGYIAPLWEDFPTTEEVEVIKARLHPLGYLE
jgi:adenylylsulfate kinase-like enzyme